MIHPEDLYAASRDNDLPVLQRYISGGGDVNKEGISPAGSTMLHVASFYGSFDCVSFLVLEARADVNFRRRDSCTPLYLASQEGRRATIEFLLRHGADPSTPNSTQMSPIYVCCVKGRVGILQMLVAAGADVSAPREGGVTPLFPAVKLKRLQCVEYLLSLPQVDVNVASESGLTALILAIETGRLASVQTLLDRGARVNFLAEEEAPNTPLFMACVQENISLPICELLLRRGALVNGTNSKGFTPLIAACHQGHLDCARLLVAYKADPNISGQTLTCLKTAIHRKHNDIVKFLISLPETDLDMAGSKGITALHMSSESELCTQLLLDAGANPRVEMGQGLVPVSLAARRGALEVVKIYLRCCGPQFLDTLTVSFADLVASAADNVKEFLEAPPYDLAQYGRFVPSYACFKFFAESTRRNIRLFLMIASRLGISRDIKLMIVSFIASR